MYGRCRSLILSVKHMVLFCCSFFQKFMSEEDDKPLLDAVNEFAKYLFWIPIPPHGRIAVVSVNSCTINLR